MLVDSNISADNGSISESVDEETRSLLATSPLAHSMFNDLTYSDDDETDEYWEWDTAELGVSGSIASPDTATLLDEIQNAMFPTQQTTTQQQQQQQLQQSHLMHPLAAMSRQKSVESRDGDELSYLAYSITSTVGDEEANRQAASTAPTNYGSLETAKPTTPVFRPSSSVFDHSSRSNFHQPKQPSWPPTATQYLQNSQQTFPRTTILKPKPNRVEHLHPNQSSIPQSTTSSRNHPSSNNSKAANNINSCYPPTPLPSITNESPVTSATATDTDRSPVDNNATLSPNYDAKYEEEPEKERITKILSEEATKRLRRHRRLKRIKKAAETREVAVQKVRGVEQEARCNDAIFAFIFLCQFLLVSMSALAFGPGALRDRIYGSLIDGNEDEGEENIVDYNPFAALQTDDVVIIQNPLMAGGGATSGIHKATWEGDVMDGISHIDYVNVIQLVCIASGYASLCSLLALGFMMMLSKNLLHVTLIFTISVSLTWTVLGLAFSSSLIIPFMGAVALALSLFYTVVVWDRISFAAINLSVALKGMRSTLHIPFVGLCVLAVTFLWTNIWICAFIGTFDFLNDDEDLSNNWMSVVIVFFLFSHFWTFQVIKGISQTAVASIIGKWWHVSEEDQLPVCGSVLHSTLSRSIIGSFGSLCLGSLIVGPCILLTRLSTFCRLAKPKLNKLKTSTISDAESDGKRDGGCIQNAPCSPHSDSVISRNVNQWSFTYVGLYGYKFWDSGSKASQLFEARGWTHVVSDDLIMTVMTMTSLIIGGSTGCLGIIVEEVDGYSFTSLHQPITTAFLIGSFVGYFLSSAFLSIVEGSVSAILVCYAAAPVEFHANHYKLSEEMKSAWKHFWLQKPLPPL
mmetsp:Transcript_24754/g.53400  ORF Transcript_24754/g.53400 Transcript_24754/m.53400 type:complete len:858 (+) Transcript_24754:443-3016(+)|eukprot:CAMPEP_0172307282 /NCGR_PEP_ID=MMETSP1058-20130122/8170_1 /TAXON_ID=83371 /ORGANISM="Detonula confervacea, Strain CCMP 353" /LENGTH=857 /DNA_ID=CAMNT_0013019413 /DNA_START=368 /DNA_END=2941 /DNA_ORIENTATION=-